MMNPSYSDTQKTFYDRKFKSLATEKMERNIVNFYFQKIKDIISSNTAIKDGSKILEVGVGKGVLMKMMTEHFSHCTFKGIDISERNVKIARQKGLDVDIMDASRIDMSEKYDLIYGTAILHHLDDAYAFLNSIGGILNSGGSILFGAENVSCEVLYVVYTKLRGVWEVEKGMAKLSPKKIKESLKDGYCNIKIYWHGNIFVYFSKTFGTIYNALRLSKIPCLNDIYVYAQKK